MSLTTLNNRHWQGMEPRIMFDGDTVAFQWDALDVRMRTRARRGAVAWMAMNPGLQCGVQRYRFDVGSTMDAF